MAGHKKTPEDRFFEREWDQLQLARERVLPSAQIEAIRRELRELERGETALPVVLRSVRRRLRAIQHQLLFEYPGRTS